MPTNTRPLTAIADAINALDRGNVFAIGERLIEAKAMCAHGEWGNWLAKEFDWSHDTATRYMNAARLATKFADLRNLQTPAWVIAKIATLDESQVAAVVARLVKAARGRRLSSWDADEVFSDIRGEEKGRAAEERAEDRKQKQAEYRKRKRPMPTPVPKPTKSASAPKPLRL